MGPRDHLAASGRLPPASGFLPELPQYPNANFGPGSFVWDVMRLRTKLDYVGRGTVPGLRPACSGMVGMRPAERLPAGFPRGLPDPHGYDDQGWTALWHDDWTIGRENPIGGLAMLPSGQPALIEAGMDTLYRFISNSWSWERAHNLDWDPDDPGSPPFVNRVSEVCGSRFTSLFQGEPVVIRYDDPMSLQGKVVWFGTDLWSFRDHELATGDLVADPAGHGQPGDIATLLRALTDWILAE